MPLGPSEAVQGTISNGGSDGDDEMPLMVLATDLVATRRLNKRLFSECIVPGASLGAASADNTLKINQVINIQI